MASSAIPSPTHVYETACIPHKIADVWKLIRPMDFSFVKDVDKHEVEEKAAGEVGAVHKLTYKDKDNTVQRLLLLGMSDLNHEVTYEVIESVPAIKVTSALYTLRACAVTNNLAVGPDAVGTFLEWTTDFSSDASQEVVQDSRFKKIDAFKAMNEILSK